MKKQIITLLALGLVAGTAAAQTKNDSTVYVGVEGAYANIAGIDTVAGYSKTSETNNVAAWRILTGYQFNQNIAVELGYFSTGDFKQSATNGSVSYNLKVKAKGVDLAAVYKFTEGVPGLFVKGGLISSKVDQSATATSGSAFASASASQSGTGYLIGVGYDLNITGGLDARVGYSRYTNLGGQSGDNANLFSVGLKYRF